MPLLDQQQLESYVSEIVDRLKAAFEPLVIYQFGSYVYGTPNRDSDIDFLVIVENSKLDAYRRDAIAYHALRGIPVPVDVLVYTRAEFDERSNLRVSFEKTVKAKGRIVYAA